MILAWRVESSVFDLLHKVLANRGSFTSRAAFVAVVIGDPKLRTQLALIPKPKPYRMSTTALGVIPRARPVLHAQE